MPSHGSEFNALLFYTSVRWLSAENVLKRVLELRDELGTFSQIQGQDGFQDVLMQSNLELAYLGDIFVHLNKLNLGLQGQGSNVITHQMMINTFLDKVELWIARVEVNNFVQFTSLNTMLEESEASGDIQTPILEHLRKLRDEFKRYFPEIEEMSTDGFSLVTNPFTTNVNIVFLRICRKSS